MNNINCAFQYATKHEVYEDTILITLEQALILWDKYIEKYKEDFQYDDEPEMAVWVDMKSPVDYHTKARYWHSSTVKVIDGDLYQLLDN